MPRNVICRQAQCRFGNRQCLTMRELAPRFLGPGSAAGAGGRSISNKSCILSCSPSNYSDNELEPYLPPGQKGKCFVGRPGNVMKPTFPDRERAETAASSGSRQEKRVSFACPSPAPMPASAVSPRDARDQTVFPFRQIDSPRERRTPQQRLATCHASSLPC